METKPTLARPDAAGIDVAVSFTLARLLERLDRSRVPVGADQYQSVVRRLRTEFDRLPAEALAHLLDTHPAAAELYENHRYAQAGLCRSPLDLAMQAELRAVDVIARARRR